jgi:hypothetical protein
VKKTDEIEGIGMGTSVNFDTTDANPNNDSNRELIELPNSSYTDPPTIAASRIYNNAGIVVQVTGPITTTTVTTTSGATTSVAASGVFTNSGAVITAKNGTTLTTTQASAILGALGNTTVVSGSTYRKGIYDSRESSYVYVTDVNVGTLNTTLNALTNFNDTLYVYDSTSSYTTKVYDSGSSSSTKTFTAADQAIRLTNGGVLPNDGLTVGTEDGLYVKGDYNTGTTTDSTVVPSNSSPSDTASTYKSTYTTKPAALVADAVMVLSNAWSDTNSSKSLSSRVASNTTMNAAIIAGYIPSSNTSSGGRSGYSGGMNNFPRFLETWSGKYMSFNGAFAQLFQSKSFTGLWDTGDIYSPPTRFWAFDTMLLQRVLPSIPPSSAFSRGKLQRM